MADGGYYSRTYSVLLLTGLILIVLSFGVAMFGAGGPITFEGSAGEYKVSTNSIGLAMMVISCAFTVYIATHLPAGVRVFNEAPSPLERFLRRWSRWLPIPLLVLGLGSFVLLIISLVWR
jgi:hypothetical protein